MAQHLGPWVAVAAGALLGALLPGHGKAQSISVDGSLAPAQTLAGPVYVLPASLGKQVGNNLFHSFSKFGLTTGESAYFNGPANVTNIVGRVTGGSASAIDGAINSTIAGANLYLINPAGMVFGPNATVNVSGAFHASTADYIRMSDGAKFQATNPSGSTMSAAAPAAFGFMTATPPALTVNGSNLGVGSGQTLGIVGGPVSITAGAQLTAPSGTIHVTSAAGTGEVPVDPTNAAGLTVAKLGSVSINGSSTIDVSDFLGKGTSGSIFLRADKLTLADGAFLEGSNSGTGPAGQISLRGDTQIALSNGARVHSIALGAGRGGDIILKTGPQGSISASSGVLVDTGSDTGATGGSGQLSVTTGTLTLTGGAIFGNSMEGSGSAGPISIVANAIVLDGRGSTSSRSLTGIRSNTLVSSGNAADITVSTGSLTILANGEIVTNTRGSGDAGRVSVSVTGALAIDATGAIVSTGIGTVASPGSTGDAGALTLTAGSLSITGNTGTLAPSPAAPGSLPFLGLSAQTLSSGAGGSIALTVGPGALTLSNGAVISSSTSGSGQGGKVAVTAQGRLTMSGSGTAITAAALDGATGEAGSVTVSANSITIQDGAQIASSTAGPGIGGAVAVTAAGDIALSGPGPQITARSTGSGNAGSILVSALNLSLSGGAAISTEATTANGGNIALAVSDFLYLVNSQITTSVKGSIGNGGNIAIDPQLIVLDSSQIIAQAVLGHGGDITIAVGQFLMSADSLVSASSSLGISGTVEITGPRVDLNGSLVVLPSELRQAAEILGNSCAMRSALPRSSLTRAGRGGLPQSPETTIPALYLADRAAVMPSRLAEAAPRTPAPTRVGALHLRLHCGEDRLSEIGRLERDPGGPVQLSVR